MIFSSCSCPNFLVYPHLHDLFRRPLTITKHEKPVAKLVPFAKPSRVELTDLFRQMDQFRAKHPLNPKGLEKLTYPDLIEGAFLAKSGMLPARLTENSAKTHQSAKKKKDKKIGTRK